jgi:threonine dehydratase
MDERGMVLAHPFNDPQIVAGQATVGLEIVEDVPDVAAVLVPIGGGGLMAGVAMAVKALRPETRVIGIEPVGAPTLTRALEEGAPVNLTDIATIADGLAAPMAGELTFEVVKRYVDDVVVIDDDSIAAALRDLLTSAKLLAEPGGAAATAAVLTRAVPLRDGERVAAIVSGGNVDIARLATLLG